MAFGSYLLTFGIFVGSAAAVVQSTVGNLAARGATGMALQDSATFPEHQFKTHILRIQVLSVSIGA